MANSLNLMLERFQLGMRQVHQSTSDLARSSEELSAVTTQTTAAVNRQRSETEQVATAMNEMTATVQEVSNNASNAAGAANEATRQSLGGKEVVNQTITAIHALADEVEKATAAEEQSAVADEINANINNISQVADETSAGSSQITLESQQLARLSSELQDLVNKFKI